MSWRLVDRQIHLPPDRARFFEIVNTHTNFFDASAPLVVARALGRLDVMGGIADYSGSLVLELPLGVAAFVAALQQETDRTATPSFGVTVPCDLCYNCHRGGTHDGC
jgi:hypothetical protein